MGTDWPLFGVRLAAPGAARSAPPVPLAIGALGCACVMTQLALLREMLCAFSGNEMVLGILLANWLLLTGAGAWLGRAAGRFRDARPVFVAGQILISLAPLAQVFALRTGLQLLFPRGSLIGLGGTLATSFFLLLPFCLASGFLLTLGCSVMAGESGAKRATAISRVYIADTLGGILGGVLFSFVFLRWFDHISLLCIPALANLLAAAWLARAFGIKRLAILSLALAGAVLAILGWGKMDDVSTAAQYSGQQVVFHGNSPYGKLVVSRSAGQLNFYENGVPVACTDDLGSAEETAHYALAQRPGAARVLLISGSVSGAAREILKHGVREVVCVELDPLVLEAGRRFRPEVWSDPRIRLVNTDGRLFVKQSAQSFDLVILGTPSPANSQINRFFTVEFFREVKRALVNDGVLAVPLAGYENYVSPELGRLLASTRQTLARAFRQVLVVPGGRTFFLASDGPLELEIAARLEQKRIATRLVQRHYLDAMLTPDRLEQVRHAAARPAAVNEDFNPVLYYYHLLYWGSQFQTRYALLAAVLLPVLSLGLLRLRPVPLAVFASGFASTALEIVLLLGFQILYGSLYQRMGVMITLFMAGLAAGALAAVRVGRRRSVGSLAAISCAIAGFAALLPALPHGLSRIGAEGSPTGVQLSIYILTFLLAGLVGAVFPLASRAISQPSAETGNHEEEAAVAATIYSADFLGACLGALLVSAVLIPLLGVAAVCWITAALNVLAAIPLAARARASL